jgi:hypothetical protein
MASLGTDIVCLVCGTRSPVAQQLDQLARAYDFYSEKAVDQPPQLVIVNNITKDPVNR